MLFLPTRGRPQMLARFINAYLATGATEPVAVSIDDDDSKSREYRDMFLPPAFFMIEKKGEGIAQDLNDLFQMFPDEKTYGFMADDAVPLTQYWDAILVEQALLHGIAWPNDLITTPGHDKRCGHWVVNGNLVRKVGYFCPPGFYHLYTDNVWIEIADRLGIGVWLEDVWLEHRHFSVDKSDYDETYERHSVHAEDDRLAFVKWKTEFNKTEKEYL